MRRATGIFLLILGIVVCVVGLLAILGGFIAANGVQTTVVFIGFFILAAGGTLIRVGVKLMRRPANIGSVQKIRTGNYQADVLEDRQCRGKPYQVLYKPPVTGKNGRPSSLAVSVEAAAPTNLRFKKQNWFDRFGLRCGLACQPQTGDLDFDQAVYVRGPSREYAEQYLEDQTKREAILALLEQRFQVRLTGTNVEAVWTGFNPKTNDRPGLTDEAAEPLFILASKLPWDGQEHISARPDSSSAAIWFLWLLAIALALSGIFMFIYPPVRDLNLLVAGLAAFVVGYPLFGLLAGLLLHGTLTAHDRWAWLMGFSLLLLGFGSFGIVAAVNALGDDGQESWRTAIVVEKHINTGGRGSKSYSITVPDWDQAGEMIHFGVSSSEYDQIIPGQSTLEVATCPGRLGIEWIKEKRLRP